MEANGIAQAVPFSCLLMAASVWDLRKRIIPDSICILIALTGLINFSPVKFLGILAALPLLIAALIKEGGMGGGDIKLTAASGFVLGLPAGIAGLILALSMVLFWHLSLRVACKIKRRKPSVAKETAFPLAPFLGIGFMIAAIFK